MKVAVTGYPGSGKSTVCKIFQKCGAYTTNDDEIVHHILTPQTKQGQEVIQLLGSEIVRGNTLDRKIISNMVFKNPELLQRLEQILHPVVRKTIREEAKQHSNESLFVAEIPLLFETQGYADDFDATIVIISDIEKCRKRFPAGEFTERMNRHYTQEKKAAVADYIILNNGSLQELASQTKTLYQQLKQE